MSFTFASISLPVGCSSSGQTCCSSYHRRWTFNDGGTSSQGVLSSGGRPWLLQSNWRIPWRTPCPWKKWRLSFNQGSCVFHRNRSLLFWVSCQSLGDQWRRGTSCKASRRFVLRVEGLKKAVNMSTIVLESWEMCKYASTCHNRE